jgi:hypothetical protein
MCPSEPSTILAAPVRTKPIFSADCRRPGRSSRPTTRRLARAVLRLALATLEDQAAARGWRWDAALSRRVDQLAARREA